jgi:hypothetical protein
MMNGMDERSSSDVSQRNMPASDEGPAEAESKRAEDMGKASFPASDLPAVWTWEPKAKSKRLVSDAD